MTARTSKRRCLEGGIARNAVLPKVFPGGPTMAATEEDKAKWKGWCEIESEPAFFNVMLQKFGVKGVKVREIVSLDPEMLSDLPRPIYGLIFLFKWKEDKPEDGEMPGSQEVWFANQTVSNACATVALLNIVNNVRGLDLGEHLMQFKDFTKDLTPAFRGEAVGNFDFVRKIHNSCARKMDMLNGDLYLKNEAFSTEKSRKKARDRQADDDEAFHFVALVPVEGKVWKLDGLENYPQDLGSIGEEDWLSHARTFLEDRMARYGDGQIEFAVLSLVRDPLVMLRSSLAENIRNLQLLTARLDRMFSGWKEFVSKSADAGAPDSGNPAFGPDPDYGIEQRMIDEIEPSPTYQERLSTQSHEALLSYRQELAQDQVGLRFSIKEEQESCRLDEEKYARRRHDYGPALRAWVQFHAEKGMIKELLEAT